MKQEQSEKKVKIQNEEKNIKQDVGLSFMTSYTCTKTLGTN